MSKIFQDHVTEETLGYGRERENLYTFIFSLAYYSRNELAMRNYLIASAAKENGAEFVALVEPIYFTLLRTAVQELSIIRKLLILPLEKNL
ncbi:MAG: hypothetical protein Ct9H300mP28_30300 [Pseudomonadota bacterium]|nr:MAG: hypothetical protein Ct9H300mP28_30300 [Pseudomonadota bacterium]